MRAHKHLVGKIVRIKRGKYKGYFVRVWSAGFDWVTVYESRLKKSGPITLSPKSVETISELVK